jgi:hypothetical protein
MIMENLSIARFGNYGAGVGFVGFMVAWAKGGDAVLM